MKALTVYQPWASLIMAGWKPYEFRGRRTPAFVIGKRIVIHASTRRIKPAEVADIIRTLDRGEFCGGLKLDAITMLEDVLMERRKLPLAAGLGTVVLGEPKRSCDLWPEEFVGFSDSDRIEHSNWAWPVSEVQRFEPIVPAKGLQGFWNWPYPIGGSL